SKLYPAIFGLFEGLNKLPSDTIIIKNIRLQGDGFLCLADGRKHFRIGFVTAVQKLNMVAIAQLKVADAIPEYMKRFKLLAHFLAQVRNWQRFVIGEGFELQIALFANLAFANAINPCNKI